MSCDSFFMSPLPKVVNITNMRVREVELTSAVLAGAMCVSSCPYILAGGEERIVSLRGIVGMHQHY